MAHRKWNWTYEQLGDAVSCADEMVATLRGVLKNSETLQPDSPEAATQIAAIEQNIDQILKLKTLVDATRVGYYMQFHKGEARDLASLAVAPFRKLA